ncbi:CPBP family intramembrane glutamic endopeptidase [Algibacter pacificus]|uniref:CPBP family intramembrane glutamic endopeptidase n=1 Tax=Algibacter pacificus TaxID=2599389 RepID=UPI0011CA7491|nr:CPBP family intramembrane glutamic endopeptidase [Algibacter pacificus]
MKDKVLLVVFLSFSIYFFLDDLYFKSVRGYINETLLNMGISHNISYLIFGIPLFLGVLLLNEPKDFFKSLGLNAPFLKGIGFSMFCTVPMFVGFSFLFTLNKELSLNEFLISGIAAAFFEELYFRGFLFGFVFRFTRLGFFLSIILGAILFAIIHLYQSQELITLVGIFLTTFIAAIIFAWVYVEWEFNIWVPIGLHFFMNLSWMLFSVSDNALGDIYANSFRIISIVLIFVFTIIYKKRNKQPFYITKKNMWFKKPIQIK